MVLSILKTGQPRCLFLWSDFCWVWFRELFWLYDILFLILCFIFTCLMVSAFNIPKYLKFSFSPNVLIFFLIWQFFYVSNLSFSTFHYKHGTFFYVKFNSNILAIYYYYYSLMDTHTWPCKSRTTSTNLYSATMWGYRMLSWRPAWGDER